MMSAPAMAVRTRPSISSFLTKLLFKCVSKHGKRIFYIASLCGQFDHYAQRHGMTVKRLNEAMRLAHREQSAHIPHGLRSRVWDGTGLEDVLTADRLEQADTRNKLVQLAREIYAISTPWRYSSEREMVDDIACALKARRECLLQEETALV